MAETMRTAASMLASALGVAEGDGCTCALCGVSSFDAAGSPSTVLGVNFTDFDYLADESAPDLCLGCKTLLGGRPGNDPPPLRTVSIRANEEALVALNRSDWWLLLDGTDQVEERGEVLSWATSRKRHHWLRAGISTPDLWAAGSDEGTIWWQPTPEPARAVMSLREVGASKGVILTGLYPVRLHATHPARIAAAELVLAPLRGQPILDLLVWAAPKPDETTNNSNEDDDMVDPIDALAADVVAKLVWGSEMRAEDGKIFWGGYLLRRLRRFSRLPLRTCVSRLMAECRVSSSTGAEVAQLIDELSDSDVAGVERRLRERPDLIHAMAFGRMATYRDSRKRTP